MPSPPPTRMIIIHAAALTVNCKIDGRVIIVHLLVDDVHHGRDVLPPGGVVVSFFHVMIPVTFASAPTMVITATSSSSAAVMIPRRGPLSIITTAVRTIGGRLGGAATMIGGGSGTHEFHVGSCILQRVLAQAMISTAGASA